MVYWLLEQSPRNENTYLTIQMNINLRCDYRGGQEEIGRFQFLVLPHPPLQQGEYGCNGSLVQGGFCNAFHKLW